MDFENQFTRPMIHAMGSRMAILKMESVCDKPDAKFQQGFELGFEEAFNFIREFGHAKEVLLRLDVKEKIKKAAERAKVSGIAQVTAVHGMNIEPTPGTDEKIKDIPGFAGPVSDAEKIEHPDVNKEMDIFAFRQNKNSLGIENIVVELKRPSVNLGELELSQIKNYMRLIYKEPQFSSVKAKWTFILVGKDFDKSGTIENEFLTNQHWGKKDLVLHIENATQNYEIYVMKWSTIFDDFEMRHDFLMKRLQFKREALTAQYNSKEDLHKIVEDAKES